MNEHLNDINWANVLSSNNVNDNWLTLKDIVQDDKVDLFPVSSVNQVINHHGLKIIYKQIKKKQ